MAQIFLNNFKSNLLSAILAADTAIPLQPGAGLPAWSAGDWMWVTLSQNGSEISWEIVKATQWSTDSLDVVERAQQATAAADWPAWSKAQNRVTAADFGVTAATWATITGNVTDNTDLTTYLSSNYAAAGHDHSGVYSPVGHDHSGVYSPVGHDHNGVYAPIAHTHYLIQSGDGLSYMAVDTGEGNNAGIVDMTIGARAGLWAQSPVLTIDPIGDGSDAVLRLMSPRVSEVNTLGIPLHVQPGAITATSGTGTGGVLYLRGGAGVVGTKTSDGEGGYNQVGATDGGSIYLIPGSKIIGWSGFGNNTPIRQYSNAYMVCGDFLFTSDPLSFNSSAGFFGWLVGDGINTYTGRLGIDGATMTGDITLRFPGVPGTAGQALVVSSVDIPPYVDLGWADMPAPTPPTLPGGADHDVQLNVVGAFGASSLFTAMGAFYNYATVKCSPGTIDAGYAVQDEFGSEVSVIYGDGSAWFGADIWADATLEVAGLTQTHAYFDTNKATTATYTDGLVLRTTSTATTGANKWSPGLRFRGSGFNEYDATAHTHDWAIHEESYYHAGDNNFYMGLETSLLKVQVSRDDGAYSTVMFFSDRNGFGGTAVVAGTDPSSILGVFWAQSFSVKGAWTEEYVRTSSTGVGLCSNGIFGITPNNAVVGAAAANPSDADVLLGRQGAGNWRFGGQPSGSPVPQITSVQNASGTDTAGALRYYVGSLATGNAASGGHAFQVGDPGASGTTLQTAATKLLIEASLITGYIPYTGQINVRAQNIASSASITPSPDTDDLVKVTALAADATFNNPTPVTYLKDGQKLLIRITDNGGSRNLTWDTQYRSVGATLPATTTAGKTTYLGFLWNSANNKWDLMSLATTA